jgi:hypothetical protein
MTAATPSSSTPATPTAAAIQGIRDTAKWAVAALAALGVAIAAGSQLSSIGSISDLPRLGLAAVVAIIGLLAVGVGIWITVDILLPGSLSLPELVQLRTGDYLATFIAENPLLLAGEADNVAGLSGKFTTAITDRRDKYKAVEENPGDKAAKDRADEADDKVDYLSSIVDRLLAYAAFERTRHKFECWRVEISIAVFVAGLAMVAFAWAGNPPKSANPTVSFRGASLVGARLVGADLSGVDLSGADLSGADLRGAKLTGATLDNVTWTGAICPDGRKSEDEGGSCHL